MSDPFVLVTVEGGVADTHVIGDVPVYVLDWDNVDGAEERWRLEEMIEDIEEIVPDSPPTIKKQAILATLREALEQLPEDD